MGKCRTQVAKLDEWKVGGVRQRGTNKLTGTILKCIQYIVVRQTTVHTVLEERRTIITAKYFVELYFTFTLHLHLKGELISLLRLSVTTAAFYFVKLTSIFIVVPNCIVPQSTQHLLGTNAIAIVPP